METTVINVFSNPVRLKLLCCLSRNKRNVSELVKFCGLEQSAVSQHLSKLKKAGLIRNERDGKYIYYSLTKAETGKIANMLNNYCEEVSK